MRMLYWPLRSPRNASNRLPGSAARSPSDVAASPAQSLREIVPDGEGQIFHNLGAFVLLQPRVVGDAGQLLRGGDVSQGQTELSFRHGLARDQLISARLGYNGAALNYRRANARIVNVESLSVAHRN